MVQKPSSAACTSGQRLFAERIGAGAWAYVVGLQRWSVRLLADQACLVDAYPPFRFTEETTPAGVTA